MVGHADEHRVNVAVGDQAAEVVVGGAALVGALGQLLGVVLLDPLLEGPTPVAHRVAHRGHVGVRGAQKPGGVEVAVDVAAADQPDADALAGRRRCVAPDCRRGDDPGHGCRSPRHRQKSASRHHQVYPPRPLPWGEVARQGRAGEGAFPVVGADEAPSPQPSPRGRGGRAPSPQPSPRGRGGRAPSPQPSPRGRGGRAPSPQPSPRGRGGLLLPQWAASHSGRGP